MIRCLLVDDEPLALRVLQAHLAHVPDVEVVAACTDAVEALAVVREQAVDLVLLDIEMPTLTGLGFVEALPRRVPVVFTTAHRAYALDGFELDAVDYLLKPVSLPRLLRALDKVRRARPPAAEVEAPGAEPPAAPPEEPPAVLHVREAGRTVRVDAADVRYVEAQGDYVRVRLGAGQVVTKARLRDLARDLAPHGLVRIHRSFLVALRHVEAFSATEVTVGGRTLPVGRTYRRAALARLRDAAG